MTTRKNLKMWIELFVPGGLAPVRIFQYFRFFSQRYYAAGFFAGELDCSARGGISSILPCLFFAVCEILVLDCRLARTRDLGSGCVAGQCG